jgi:hypothetical protein
LPSGTVPEEPAVFISKPDIEAAGFPEISVCSLYGITAQRMVAKLMLSVTSINTYVSER